MKIGTISTAISALSLVAWSGSAIQAAAPAIKSFVEISASGRTHVARKFGNKIVTVGIAGHALPLNHLDSQDRPADARCTGGRDPCMVVDSLAIRVDGHDVEVPRSVLVTLSDVNRAGLSAAGAGLFKLVLEGGDASASYTAVILFDAKRVRQRDVIDGEAGMLAERTIYRDLSHAFRD